MPNYEFRCRACGRTFIESRPMSESGDPAVCPSGHDDTVRLLGIASAPKGSAGARSGGCCGGGCGCG